MLSTCDLALLILMKCDSVIHLHKLETQVAPSRNVLLRRGMLNYEMIEIDA